MKQLVNFSVHPPEEMVYHLAIDNPQLHIKHVKKLTIAFFSEASLHKITS